MATVPQVTTALQTVLTSSANCLACRTGFIRRQRQLTGASFAQGLVFGWLTHAAATDDQLAQAVTRAGNPISPQGLEQRFMPEAATFLQQVLAAATETVIRADEAAASLLQRFAGVWLLDTTIIPLPAVLAQLWPGSGKGEAQR